MHKNSRLPLHVAFAVVAVAVMTSLQSPVARADCGYPAVTVSGTSSQSGDACRALTRVVAYFADLGFEIVPRVAIRFSEQVFIDGRVSATHAKTSRIPVLGFFDADRQAVAITSVDTGSQPSRTPWMLTWGPPIARSILHHELAHMAIYAALGEHSTRLSKAWMEFVAYAVEFDLMDPVLRKTIRGNYPGVTAFAYPSQVNAMLHAIDPDRFAIMAHLYAEANGGRDFIRRLLRAEVEFGTGEFFWRH